MANEFKHVVQRSSLFTPNKNVKYVGELESTRTLKGRKSLRMKSKYAGKCAACHYRFGKNAYIVWIQNPSQSYHADCFSAKFKSLAIAVV